MKILLCQTNVYAPTRGGSIRGNRELLENLVRLGHQCLAIAPATSRAGLKSAEEVRTFLHEQGCAFRERSGGGFTFTLGGVPIEAIPDVLDFRPTLERAAQDFAPSAVLIQDESPGQTLLEALPATLAARTIYLVRTVMRLPFGPDSVCPNPAAAARLKDVALVLCTSRYAEDYVRRWAPLPEQGGPSITRLPLPAIGMDRQPPPHFGRHDQGFVTMLNPSGIKGLPIFLELAQAFPTAKFAAVPGWGTTPSDLESLTALANVELLPPAENMDDILGRTRILVVPSLCAETYGRAGLEAMLRGIPVLASNVGGLAETKLGVDYLLPVAPITSYRGTTDALRNPEPVIPPQPVGPWQAALRELLEDSDRYDQISKASRDAALAYLADLRFEDFEARLAQVAQDAPAAVRSTAQQGSAAPGWTARMTALSPAKRALLLARVARKFSATHTSGTGSGSLIQIQPGGAKPILFCFHPHTGLVHYYQRLAKSLGPDQPVYALQARGLDGLEPPDESVEAMAGRYVREIERVQPHGPYHLLGSCSGGLIAYEVARQLERKNHAVALLGLIQTTAPPHSIFRPGFSRWRRRLVQRVRWLQEHSGAVYLLPARERLSYLRPLAWRFGRRLRALWSGLAGNQSALPADNLRRVEEAHTRANVAYQPGPFSGRVVLFESRRPFAAVMDPAEAWRRAGAREVIVCRVPVFPGDLLNEPRLRSFIPFLSRHLP